MLYSDPKVHLRRKALNPVAVDRPPITQLGKAAVGRTTGTAPLHPALHGGIGTVGTVGTVVGMTATLDLLNGTVMMRVDTTTTSELQ